MKNDINGLINNYINTSNVGLQYYNLLNIYNNDKSNTNILFLLVEYSIYLCSCIDTKKYLNKVKYSVKDNNIYYNYLLDKYNSISNDNKYLEFINNKVLLNNLFDKDYYLFIEECNKKYIHSFNSEYLFLIGQKMYLNGYYRHALYYLDKYIKIGVISLREAYIYLFYISNNEIYLKKIYELTIYDNSIDINTLKQVIVNNKNKYINKEIIYILHDIYSEILLKNNNYNKKLTIIS